MEVKHANGIRRSAPFLPQQRVLLKNLWKELPEKARQKSLLTLSQIVARQIVPPPEKKGGEKKNCGKARALNACAGAASPRDAPRAFADVEDRAGAFRPARDRVCATIIAEAGPGEP